MNATAKTEKFVIYNTKAKRVVKDFTIRLFATSQAGKTAVAALVRKSKGELTKMDFEVLSYSEFQEKYDPLVETKNILNPSAGPIMIRLSEKGGCTDPGTERYHSM